MTEEEKQILLQDLCTRLPYGVKCRFLSIDGSEFHNVTAIGIKYLEFKNIYELNVKDENGFPYSCDIEYIKPYLRPMSNMTKEELKEFVSFTSQSMRRFICEATNTDHWFNNYEEEDWLNAHHFDYRGLIEMGLALPAPEGMYKLKQ